MATILERSPQSRHAGLGWKSANKPTHPSGKPFVISVEHQGYYMEAHEGYKNAIAHLGRLAKELRLPFKYLG
ncbi:MAG TPA: hypothetical protein VKG65_12305 [Terriglobales bacterium]|nr:hypothetical protein [Terriglobales bacterium]